MPAITAKAASSSEILMFYSLHVHQNVFVPEYDFHANKRQAGEKNAARHYANILFSELKKGGIKQKKRHLERYRFTFAIGRHLRSGESLSRKYSRDRATLYLA